MSALAGKFGNVQNDYSTAEYAETQLTEIINTQQDAIYELKNKVNGHISLIYDDFGLGSYSYTVPEPMDIGKELTKEVISSVAGAYNSEIADFAASVATNVIDGEDVASALGSELQETVQNKLADAATGGLYSKFNDVANVVSAFQSMNNKLSNTTPNYVLKHLHYVLQQRVTELGKFLDDDSVTAEDLLSLIETLRGLEQIEKSIEDINNTFGTSVPCGGVLRSAEETYSLIVTDCERMPYYFALMEG